MNENVIYIAMAFTILNAILTLFIIKFNEQTQIKEFKKSKLSLNFEKTLRWSISVTSIGIAKPEIVPQNI